MQKACLVGAFVLLVTISTQAQEFSSRVEFTTGFSYLRFDSSPFSTQSTNFVGWQFSGEYKFKSWLGGTADFMGQSGASTFSPAIHTFLFGPRVALPRRISPFAHFLIGGAHFDGRAANTSFGTALGCGFNWKYSNRLSWRPIQVDYLATRFFHSTQNNARISTGVVFRF